ncbi:leucine-rich repeat neuronal protein 1 [Trichonephila clavata]|uniref:Leucine-rich repeat neuronal protein 1 n=1 Tax=Trichonephila clavata TaxID=2740835 RepID=A0A8X6KAP8_TRICU|nr:leucine-rich repeat neuronal protein 1 [Trichonephila clavata]
MEGGFGSWKSPLMNSPSKVLALENATYNKHLSAFPGTTIESNYLGAGVEAKQRSRFIGSMFMASLSDPTSPIELGSRDHACASISAEVLWPVREESIAPERISYGSSGMRDLQSLLLLLLPASVLASSCPVPCPCSPGPTVNCSGLHLERVPQGLPSNTVTLLLNSNNLTDLYGQLPPLPSLVQLDLSRNQLKQLGRGLIFHNFSRLQSLDLSHNDFRTVFNGVFRGINQLHTLLMTHGQIKFIEEHVFDGLTQLRKLHLSHNQLNAIFPEWFRELLQLEELLLENNHISHVNGGCFASLSKLRILSLNGNRIKGVSDSAFEGLRNLTTLYLEDNQLSRVPSASLQATQNLKVLRLGGNFFPQLHTNDFVRLNLEEVFAENVAGLVLVDQGAFWDLPYLRTVHLHHNTQLQFVDRHAFINVPNLRILSLHGNNLSALSEDVIHSFRKPIQVSLQENPLTCDCNIKWIYDNLKKGNGSRVKISGTLVCKGPPEFQGMPVLNLDSSLISDNCPPVLVGATNLTVDKKIGEEHVFQCRAHGLPAPRIHWVLPDGNVLNQTSNEPRLRFQDPRNLELRPIRTSDQGAYVCVAENALGEAIGVTYLEVENIDIHLFPQGVAATFVTVVWNGTARNAFPEYEIVYRREEDGAKEYQSVTVNQFFRSYTINNLRPRTPYKFCIGLKSKKDKQYVQFSCTWVRTRDESFMLQGIHRTSNVAVAAVSLSSFFYPSHKKINNTKHGTK